MSEQRVDDLRTFYSLLDQLRTRIGGPRKLSDCDGRMSWPNRGVDVVFEDGERRSHSGNGGRVVRVGTHTLKVGSKTTLWNRLSQHRGSKRAKGGNHRGSVFRLHVGTALLHREPNLRCPSWATGSSMPAEVRQKEHFLEAMVSEVISNMSFLWLEVGDPPGPQSERGYIERNTIGLLSNFERRALDQPTAGWLGRFCASERVRRSGLWNSNHVDESYDDAFLDRFEQLVTDVQER